MKKRPQIKIIQVPVYGCTVTLMRGGDWSVGQAEKYWAEKIIKVRWDGDEHDVRDLGGAHLHCEQRPDCALWFKREKPGLSVVSHEVFHATANILRKIGVTFSKDSEEAFAYLYDWLIMQVGNEFWWKKKPKKRKHGKRTKKTSRSAASRQRS